MKRTTTLTALLGLSLLLPQGAATEPRYFPLEPGTIWSYSQSLFEPELKKQIVVVERMGDRVLVRRQAFLPMILDPPRIEERLVLRDRGAEIDVWLRGRDFGPYYYFQEDSWIHRHPRDSCLDGSEVVVEARDVTITVPAGTFSNCLRLSYRDQGCIVYMGGRGYDVWCPDIGLVTWVQYHKVGGANLWSLESIDHLPVFERGDTNGDARLDISDPVATLNHLFLGKAELSCDDAADANDDGNIDISDAVATLSFLFLGGPPPPPPSGGACGIDLTEDELDCASGDKCPG